MRDFVNPSFPGFTKSELGRVIEDILPGWEISLAFVSPKVALDLNKKLRGKNYIPNVLSYEVGPKHGEIIICKSVAAQQAPSYNLPPATYLLLLFIHALLHLGGMRHGVTMERREKSLLSTYGSSNHHRHRHRDVSDKDRRRRRTAR